MMAAPAFAAEPLVGFWQMISQQIGKNHMAPSPLAIRISEAGSSLRFDYLLNRELHLQMTFTVRMDGTPGVVVDDKGSTLGIAKLSKNAENDYKLVLQRPNTHPEPGKLTITDQGNILRCESDANVPGLGPSHIVQMFSRLVAEP